MAKEKKEKRTLTSKLIFLFLILALLYLYAHYVGTKGIKLREYNIISENIPDSFDGFKILQFSDLELGSTFNIPDLDELVTKINKQNPDIVVFTGDIISKGYDVSVDDKNTIINAFKSIDANIGKYSIKGDDDIDNSIYDKLMSASDFIDITNNYETIYYKGMTPIVIYGLSSLLKDEQDFENTFSYPGIDDDKDYLATYKILLVHEPDTVKLIKDYDIDLTLAGHSHNSELNIPYITSLYNIKGAQDYYDEHYKLDYTDLYVSSGLGTSKLRMRFLSHPSISLFKLYKK